MVEATPDFSGIVAALREAGLVRSAAPGIRPLTGGVSSEILLIDDWGRQFVVKRALAKLRVRDDWFADVSRNAVERRYLGVAAKIVPGGVPQVWFAHPTDGWFAMEFLGDGFSNWKSLLLEGRAEPAPAARAGEVMGRIHRRTWGDANLAREFSTVENFRQLRLAPYLETTADRVPELSELLRAESARLAGTSLALVHGDFSPKNILLSPGRFVLLDAEVGWFGDPVFDAAFLLNHFFLKALLHASKPEPFLALVPAFWTAYAMELGGKADAELERRTVRLLLCLLLARVHGKSPVEYLPEPGSRTLVTEFVRKHLPQPPSQLAELTADWRAALLHR